jgi:PadR family transcriptional regulator, regulatory protein PadR
MPDIRQPSQHGLGPSGLRQLDNDHIYVVWLHSNIFMVNSSKLSYTSAIVLQTIGAGYSYGFDIMDVTGLPSGTVYPALRRLEQQELIKSKWEKQDAAFAEERPARKYYQLTRQGKDSLARARKRFALLEQLAKDETSRRR